MGLVSRARAVGGSCPCVVANDFGALGGGAHRPGARNGPGSSGCGRARKRKARKRNRTGEADSIWTGSGRSLPLRDRGHASRHNIHLRTPDLAPESAPRASIRAPLSGPPRDRPPDDRRRDPTCTHRHSAPIIRAPIAAGMAKLVDAGDLKSPTARGVRVRLPLPASDPRSPRLSSPDRRARRGLARVPLRRGRSRTQPTPPRLPPPHIPTTPKPKDPRSARTWPT